MCLVLHILNILKVDFKFNEVSVNIYRMGYYGGKGGRHIMSLGPFTVKPQPTPPVEEHRLRECQWERTVSLKIPGDWVSGVYLGKLSCKEHRYESYIIFASERALFISYRMGNDWSPGEKLSEQVNIPGSQNGGPYVSPDGKTLYYSSSLTDAIMMIPINIPNKH